MPPAVVPKKTHKSRLLAEIHETVRELHRAGMISKHRMREYDTLCHLDAPALRSARN
jgi:DNA-binding transcriptional regulator YiaG